MPVSGSNQKQFNSDEKQNKTSRNLDIELSNIGIGIGKKAGPQKSIINSSLNKIINEIAKKEFNTITVDDWTRLNTSIKKKVEYYDEKELGTLAHWGRQIAKIFSTLFGVLRKGNKLKNKMPSCNKIQSIEVNNNTASVVVVKKASPKTPIKDNKREESVEINVSKNKNIVLEYLKKEVKNENATPIKENKREESVEITRLTNEINKGPESIVLASEVDLQIDDWKIVLEILGQKGIAIKHIDLKGIHWDSVMCTALMSTLKANLKKGQDMTIDIDTILFTLEQSKTLNKAIQTEKKITSIITMSSKLNKALNDCNGSTLTLSDINYPQRPDFVRVNEDKNGRGLTKIANYLNSSKTLETLTISKTLLSKATFQELMKSLPESITIIDIDVNVEVGDPKKFLKSMQNSKKKKFKNLTKIVIRDDTGNIQHWKNFTAK